VIVDDAKCFDQFCSLKTFVQSIQNDEDFKSALVSDMRVKYFQKSCNTNCHSELFKIAELFFSISGHNTNVEKMFSFMNVQ
jgi:hypothetical protein